MEITLYLNDKILNFRLPNEISGSFSFGALDDDIPLVNVEARDGNWVLYQTSDVKIILNNSYVEQIVLSNNSFYVLRKGEETFLISVRDFSSARMLIYDYKDNVVFNIGNDPKSHIYYVCDYLKQLDIQMISKDSHIVLENKHNHIIYLNKFAIKQNPCVINYGDELEIYGLRIMFLKGMLLITNILNKLSVNTTLGCLTKHQISIDDIKKDIIVKDIDLYNRDDYFSKSPRIRRLIENKTIKLSSPPRDGEDKELPLILVIGPMLTMAVTAGTMLMNTINGITTGKTTLEDSWMQLVTSGVMLASTILWPLITQAYNRHIKKKKKKQTIGKYTKYLDEKRKELQEEKNLQRGILYENLITTQDCLNIIENRRKNQANVMHFWDKRIDQSDFLVARVGVGEEKLAVQIEYPDEEFTIEESELKNKADQLVKDFKYISDVPVSYSFYENKTTAVISVDDMGIYFMNNILLQLITFYSYEDLKIVLFTNEKRKKYWDYLRYLNHSFNNEKSFRFVATDQESTKNLSEYINFEIRNRSSQINGDKSPLFKPYYLIIVDDYDMVKQYDFVKTLTEIEANLGISLVILENRLSKLPSKCNNFITINGSKCGILKNSYENQEQISFSNEINRNINMMSIAKVLSNIPIEFEDGIKQLPDAITFLEMEKVGKVEQLNILNRWNTNDSTTSLKAEVGVDEQGYLMYLDLHEKYHGPHGLIAGMTGSGKSEFIITYILSMAINYSPDDVSFILIDYKGGGLAFAFENKTTGVVLPHLAGTITNLDKAEMDRTLVSIDSEIKRRQKIFNEARDLLGESTIDIYKYQRMYKEGKLTNPVPHLFIICDEFAELKVQQPEFMDNLISVARIGRSLGVHLILATQKPSGVVNDQIWSNTKFRVCLKVQDESDSKEMLKRPEAASIKQTGRYYLQVGYDELFALGQSGWCGAKYYPTDKIVKQIDKSVNFIDDNGNSIKSIQASNNIKLEAKGEQLAAIMNEIINVSKQVSKVSRKLWLDNIPEVILVNDLENKYQITHKPYEVCAVIGEYDAPENQEQGVVNYNFLEDGNTLIYGNDGSERELLLNTLIYSSCKNHLVDEVNYYIIDYGSESLRKYIKLPHVGGMVFQGEDEKYNNLMKLLKQELQDRKKLLADFGGEYKNYIKTENEKLPLKVVIINNYDSLYEANPNVYEELPDLIRDSERYGIIFIISCSAVNSVQAKISQNCHNIYTYKLKDSSDYTTIFGVRTKVVPRDIEGRGLLKSDNVHEFQTANIISKEEDLNDFIINFIDEQKQINVKKAKRIPVLPDIIRYSDIQDEVTSIRNVPVGISRSELDICSIDYLANLGNIISSNKIKNTEKFVKSLLAILTNLNNTSVFIFDAMKTLLGENQAYPNYYNNNFEDILDKLNLQIEKLIEAKSKAEGIVLIYGFNKFISKIEDKSKIDKFTELIKKYENIGVIIVDDASKIKTFSFEAWFMNIFNTNEGIWIGKGISDQSLLHLSTVSREMIADYKNDMGFVVSESSGTLCKFIDFITSDDKGDENGK